MSQNTYQPTDKSYKFMYKRLGIKLHQYFFNEGNEITFIDTEIAESGKRRDITVNVDGKYIHTIEFQSTPTYDKKLYDMYDYHKSIECDKNNDGLPAKSSVINISNPNRGKDNVEIKYNINFHPDIIFTKEKNGWEILSTLIYKVFNREELCDSEAIDLLILPDMNINMKLETLMKIICFLINHANIPDKTFKENIIICEIKVLERFFTGNELSEMVKMLKYERDNPEIMSVVEKYGRGFEVIYFDGKYEGKLEIAKNMIKEGVNEEIISRYTKISVDQIKKLKRKL